MAGLVSRVCPGGGGGGGGGGGEGGDQIWRSGQSGGTTILGGPSTA